jgi:HMG-box domain
MNRSEVLINGSAFTDAIRLEAGRLPNPIASQNSSSTLDSRSDDEQHEKESPARPHHDPDLPKRPLSAYNLFFQLERENILKGEEDRNYTFSNIARIALIHYKECRLGKPKRKHRKSHGVIGFRELARLVAQKWKKLDDSIKNLFEERAQIEKALYQKEIDALQRMEKRPPDSFTLHMGSTQQLVTQYCERNTLPGPTPFSNLSEQSQRNNFEIPHFDSKTIGKPAAKQRCLESTGHGQGVDAPKTPTLFQPVEVAFETVPLSAGIMMEHKTDFRTDMRMRPNSHQWQISNSLPSRIPLQYEVYETVSWANSTDGLVRQEPRQPRRNSTSFYPIDDDEQVDLIELNESFRGSKADPNTDGMSEEESEISALLHTFGTNNDVSRV